MFAYCLNNPVVLNDQDGAAPDESVDVDGDGKVDYYVYSYTYTETILFWTVEHTSYVYIYVCYEHGSELDDVPKPSNFNHSSDLIAAYYVSTNSNGEPNPVIYAHQAQKISSKYRLNIIACFKMFDNDFDTPWDRSVESLLIEWRGHHRYSLIKRAQDIDFDNDEEGMPGVYYDVKAISGFVGIVKDFFTNWR